MCVVALISEEKKYRIGLDFTSLDAFNCWNALGVEQSMFEYGIATRVANRSRRKWCQQSIRDALTE